MPVSSSYFSSLRFFESLDTRSDPDLPNLEQRYDTGTRLCDPLGTKRTIDPKLDPKISGILRIIENFNSEPLFIGNGIFLFNRASRFFPTGGPLAPNQAIELIQNERPVLARLGRVRPVPLEHAQVQIVPLKDFSYQIESVPSLLRWWQTVGRNFHDGVF